MRYYQLLEYNKPKLIQQYEQVFDNKSRGDHQLKLRVTLKQLDSYLQQNNISKTIDPYIKWIVHRYVTDGIKRWEDVFAKTIPALITYDKLKKKNKLEPNERDINKIKSESELLNLIDKYREEELTSGSSKEKEIENNFYKTDQAELLYNTNQYKIVVPKTPEASCYFGRNTRWCTSSHGYNPFNEYHEEGPLYIILHKPTNRRWQFHFASTQYMDEEDNEIDLHQLKNEHPEIINFFTTQKRVTKIPPVEIELKFPMKKELENRDLEILKNIFRQLGVMVDIKFSYEPEPVRVHEVMITSLSGSDRITIKLPKILEFDRNLDIENLIDFIEMFFDIYVKEYFTDNRAVWNMILYTNNQLPYVMEWLEQKNLRDFLRD